MPDRSIEAGESTPREEDAVPALRRWLAAFVVTAAGSVVAVEVGIRAPWPQLSIILFLAVLFVGVPGAVVALVGVGRALRAGAGPSRLRYAVGAAIGVIEAAMGSAVIAVGLVLPVYVVFVFVRDGVPAELATDWRAVMTLAVLLVGMGPLLFLTGLRWLRRAFARTDLPDPRPARAAPTLGHPGPTVRFSAAEPSAGPDAGDRPPRNDPPATGARMTRPD